jgi:serine/threonine protein kinase
LELAPLGEGSFGIVYKAKYFGSDVAVKKIKFVGQVPPKILSQFTSEVAIMHKLRHPNIVLFMGTVTQADNLCIVTQYCSNGNLYDISHNKETQYSLAGILNIGKKIATGMSYLHGNKIIHRDLKSLNVLMDEHNSPKIADFGLSRVKTESAKTKTITQVGTFLWMVT